MTKYLFKRLLHGLVSVVIVAETKACGSTGRTPERCGRTSRAPVLSCPALYRMVSSFMYSIYES